jgi:hypothetical protein
MIYQKKAIANKDITLSLLNTINLDPDNDLKIIELIEKMSPDYSRLALPKLKEMKLEISKKFSADLNPDLFKLYNKVSVLIEKLEN